MLICVCLCFGESTWIQIKQTQISGNAEYENNLVTNVGL